MTAFLWNQAGAKFGKPRACQRRKTIRNYNLQSDAFGEPPQQGQPFLGSQSHVSFGNYVSV